MQIPKTLEVCPLAEFKQFSLLPLGYQLFLLCHQLVGCFQNDGKGLTLNVKYCSFNACHFALELTDIWK